MARGNRGDDVAELEALVNAEAEAQNEAPANGEGKRPRRQTPEGEVISLDELEKLSVRTRGGIWFERAKWFRENPGQVKVYRGVNPTTATHLKKNHGLQAATRNTKDNGKTADLIVGYFPEGMEVPSVFRAREKKSD
jgi:hypothetical protein